MLNYRPPPSAPLFRLVSREPCMESPNQYLSREPSFARIAPTSFEIQGSKVCSTIRPLPLRHCFAWSQRTHVWKAPTSTFHQNLELPGLLQPVSRSKGPKCARLSAPCLCATVLVGFKGTMYGKPQPVPFTRTFICQDCSNEFRDPRVQSVLDYPPPASAPLFWLVSKEPCMESPNQYLSPEPSFARIAPTSFEIQGSKVCSTPSDPHHHPLPPWPVACPGREPGHCLLTQLCKHHLDLHSCNGRQQSCAVGSLHGLGVLRIFCCGGGPCCCCSCCSSDCWRLPQSGGGWRRVAGTGTATGAGVPTPKFGQSTRGDGDGGRSWWLGAGSQGSRDGRHQSEKEG